MEKDPESIYLIYLISSSHIKIFFWKVVVGHTPSLSCIFTMLWESSCYKNKSVLQNHHATVILWKDSTRVQSFFKNQTATSSFPFKSWQGKIIWQQSEVLSAASVVWQTPRDTCWIKLVCGSQSLLFYLALVVKKTFSKISASWSVSCLSNSSWNGPVGWFKKLALLVACLPL